MNISHAYHEGLPGFSEDQVVPDGCPACDARAAHLSSLISSLTPEQYAAACDRAMACVLGRLRDVSDAEYPLLLVLHAVALQERSQPVLTGALS